MGTGGGCMVGGGCAWTVVTSVASIWRGAMGWVYRLRKEGEGGRFLVEKNCGGWSGCVRGGGMDR